MTKSQRENRLVAELCKKVFLVLRSKDGKIPRRTLDWSWTRLEGFLKQYRARLEEAEADASELHNQLMDRETALKDQDSIIQYWKETDMVYLQTLGLAKAVVQLLGKECATEVGFREWHHKWQEAEKARTAMEIQADRRDPRVDRLRNRLEKVIEILSEHDEVLAYHLKDLNKE